MLLALDNTDGRQGGCTTQLALAVLDALPELALRAAPKLVRLNPNVPWKTRGNGAVVLDLGMAAGESAQVGFTSRGPLFAYSNAAPAPATVDVLERAWDVVVANAQPDAQPGLLVTDVPPTAEWYWRAVRTFVPPDEAVRAAAKAEMLHCASGDGRGLVGCLAAAAWTGPPSSHELIAYRPSAEWGTPRNVQAAALAGLDESGATFHTSWGDRLLCVPHGPDPVLLGLRGRDAHRLVAQGLPALLAAGGSGIAAWILWQTNQASGDHVTLVPDVAQPVSLGTMQFDATVVGMPETRRGGHVFVPLRDAAGTAISAAAFEPTGRFRDLVRMLRPGDAITIVGPLREGALALEKLAVRRVARVEVKAANPVCCGKAVKSRGRGKGYRCAVCHTRWPVDTATVRNEERRLRPGWFEVPPNARRHLHRPLAFAGDAGLYNGLTTKSSNNPTASARTNVPTRPAVLVPATDDSA